MDEKRIKEEIKSLTKKIHRYNHAFFQEGKSLISDHDFDRLVHQLRDLEKAYPQHKQPDSPTMRVGEAPTAHFPTVVHHYPMYSLDNTYEEGEVEKFIARVAKNLPGQQIDFFCELKIDGIALSLDYQQGKLQRIITRGDGKEGDDITINQVLLNHLPMQINAKWLPEHITVRGEAFMPKAAFQKLNGYYATQGKPALANPRNATAGLIRTKKLDPIVKKMQPLAFVPYKLCSAVAQAPTQAETLDLLRDWGFQVKKNARRCHDKDEIMRYIDHWEGERDRLPMMIDGIVIKVNKVGQQKVLGTTVKSPRWAIAYKYKPAQQRTTLCDVIFQVGRTGAITPVAVVNPVLLAGTTVRRASLYNAQEIKRLQLKCGDGVFIEKGGDIIPKITKVDRSMPNTTGVPILFPSHCPDCETLLVKADGEAIHYCPNRLGCPTQLKGKLLHFARRKALDITSLGNKTIGLLFEKKLIRHPVDLFSLTAHQLEALEGFQQKSAQNLLKGVQAAREKPFQRVLFGLGIPHVGETVVKKLLDHFGDIDLLMNASEADLTAIPEVGKKIADSLHDYFNVPFYRLQIGKLRNAGLSFATKQPMKSAEAGGGLPLTGQTFVVSGIFTQHSREGIRTLIQAQGGRIVSAISKKVDGLVAGEKAGAQKQKKATTLGIPILSETDLEAKIALP